MKFSEHIQIAKRAIKHLFTLSRRYTICLILHSVLKSLLPYVPIYFSARLIDALYERQPVERLTLYILLTVGLVFVLSLANVYVSSRQSILSNELYRNEEWMFSEKAMQMALSLIHI